tara:strand:+ start:489 stop:695 length:207 start_codon:yes stop_codon:yes gene_type:complete
MSKQSKLEIFKEMLDDKAFTNVFSSESIVRFKEMIDMVAREQYEKGYNDGSNQLNQIFSNLVGSSARN